MTCERAGKALEVSKSQGILGDIEAWISISKIGQVDFYIVGYHFTLTFVESVADANLELRTLDIVTTVTPYAVYLGRFGCTISGGRRIGCIWEIRKDSA